MSSEGATRRVTMRDIAAAAGVPVSAVALALNDKPGVSADRRLAVLDAAEQLGYERVSKPASRPLVGLIMEELSASARSDGFVDTVIQGVYAAARAQQAQVILGMYRPGVDTIAELRDLAGRPLDGMLIANGGDITPDVIDGLLASRVPAVLVENRVEQAVSSVSGDNFGAGLACTQHLLDAGHTRIAMIRGSERYASLQQRFFGYAAAMAGAGVSIDPKLVCLPLGRGQRKGYDETKALFALSTPPTAIYAASDKTAFGAAAALHELGLVVGRDISLVGTDNVYSAADQQVPLTTFDTSSAHLGEAALERLLNVGSGSPVTHTVLAGSLVKRASSASPR